jgi:hypothetical protein
MADLNLQIELTPELEVYEPGSTVAGRVTITSPEGPWKADAVELVIFWRTAGIGTRDTGVGTSISLSQKGTELPGHFTREFELPVPLHPYTYNGRLIKIDWFIGLRVKKGWLSKQELELPIEVRPSGAMQPGYAPAYNPRADGAV